MSDCPLVRLAYNRKILKQFDESGMVAIPLTDWLWVFETLAFINRDGHQEIYCGVVEGYLVFSKTPFKKKPALRQQDLFNKEAHLCHISKTQ